MNALFRWLGGRADRDGAATELEAGVTGIPASLLEPKPLVDVETPTVDRRRRALVAPEDVLLDTLAQKVLHGWLQNRHQTLLPLTVNFKVLSPEACELLTKLMGAALLACAAGKEDEQARATTWLRAHGANDVTVASFQSALTAPQPLYALLEAIRQESELGPLALILVMIVSDTRERSDQLFTQWVSAKLDLPNTVVRSIERRYRR